jgi:lipoprotein-anchoring transpeptidase ErfK/SrfK
VGTPRESGEAPDRLIVVDVARQLLSLVEAGSVVGEWPVSTAQRGIGGEEGSERTPPGWHRVRQKIGAGAEPGTVFEQRTPNGQVWRGEQTDRDLILSRIITLEGLEDRVNRGPGCDSLQRFIYIHGTNHVAKLGQPASHGCVRMAGEHVIALFDLVVEHDPVLIVPPGH